MFIPDQLTVAVIKPAPTRRRPVRTAVHQAVLDGRLHQVRLLVNKQGLNVDSKDVFGRTPLMLACMLENEEDGFKMVKIFLKADAFVNVLDSMNRSALSYACMKGRAKIVAKLLSEDILDINFADNDGNTPIHYASLCGNPDVVKMMTDVLVRVGLSVDGRNQNGYTPLLLASKYGHYASAYILLTAGQASPMLRDNEFFLNAHEWVTSSTEMNHSLNLNRSRTVPSFPRFTRETTVYHQCSVLPAVCNHTKPPSHPLGQSLDITLRLPAAFSYFPVEKPQEAFVDGEDARVCLQKAIDDSILAAQARLRPLSRVSSVATQRPPHPATAKLLAIGRKGAPPARGRRLGVPSLRMLFKLYADQYQPPSFSSAEQQRRLDVTKSTGDMVARQPMTQARASFDSEETS